METEVRWKNEHNIWVSTGLATQVQLNASVNAFKKELTKMFPGQGYDKCEILVNLVMDVKGNSYKYAYLWVSDPRVYYILSGFNPDGSERFEEEKEEKKTVLIDDTFDLENLDLDSAFKSESKKIKKPSIRASLPPLLTLPGYEYTEDQKKTAEADLKAEAIGKGRNPEDIKIPEFGYFESSRAWAGTPKKNENSSILCSYVPIWVNEEILKKIFYRFSSDKTGTYPKISFRPCKKRPEPTGDFVRRFEDPVEKKLAIVEFNRGFHQDGVFALQMTRKVVLNDITSPKKEGVPQKTITIIFEHFKNSEENESKPNQSSFNKSFTKGGSKGYDRK
jgi:hypothetical protein